MDKKKIFLSGMLSGMIAIILANTLYHAGMFLYGRTIGYEIPVSKKIDEIFSILDDHFVEDYDKEFLIETMYYGLVDGIGDRYTTYMDRETLGRFLEQTEGSYVGIGLYASVDETDNRIYVMPFDGSPAQKAGILPRDKIIKVNGYEVNGNTLEDAVSMMKGKEGTSVTITVFRQSANQNLDFEVVREKIDVPTVTHEMVNDEIGYLRISNFERVTYKQFLSAYEDLRSQQMKGLIIDVRNNPGGLLDVVGSIADELMPEGVIVYTEDKRGNREYLRSDSKKSIDIPLVILVNENSASASEVLSGAIKDTGIGTLVGTQTYGKGLVQNLYFLPDNSGVKVTIAKYYTPNGISIHGIGLKPDYVVEMSNELSGRISTLELEEDVQLIKAIEVMNNKLVVAR